MKRPPEPEPRFIEVVGEGRYDERIQTFVAQVTAVVTSTRKTGAAERGGAFVRRCLDALLSAGLERGEIEEAGADLGPDWWRKQNRSVHRFVVRTSDLSRLSGAMEAVEQVGKQRKSVSVQMKRPLFGADPEQKARALRDAAAAARQKAEVLATECGLALGPVLRAEEQPPTERASGFLGDEDWSGGWGFAIRRRAAPGAARAAPEPLGTPNRTITVNVRVRFGVRPPLRRKTASPRRRR